jgi:hypothetical protein
MEKRYNGREGSKIIRENHLDFLYDLYLQQVEIGPDNLALLKQRGYIQERETAPAEKALKEDKINEHKLTFATDKNREIDKRVDIVIGDHGGSKVEVLTDEELEERRKLHGLVFEGRSEPITREDWAPKSTTEHEPAFVEWVNSINNYGFKNKTNFRKFALYCQQAYTWLSEKSSYTDFEDEDEREEFKLQELLRCDENALYFLNKYVYYKEGDDESGRIKYIARPVHEVMAYLDDCGYSCGIAKGRQIAATTTLMALDVRDAVFKTNHFMKFITEDVEKAQEIFEDKLKFVFSELPWWMKPNVLNERDNLFKLGNKPEKGTKDGVGSKIMVVAPKRTAIAGGAPQKVKIDEAGNINILGIMIGNARPTMRWYNPKTKKLEVKRRLWFWGTGGEMEKGGKAFETEFMAIKTAWDKGDYSSSIIPIFFDWTCRPGIRQEDFDNEKRVAYAKGEDKQDPDAKRHITEFHQSYPSSLSDVFRTRAKTLFDDDYIENALKRINEAKFNKNFELHQSGYFEPIYDYGAPADENSDVPYKIIGANFVPTEDIDARASVTIFMHPKHGWKNRYFQGTDPIDTDTGLSNMASCIWDKYYKAPAAILNYRTKDYPEVFLQTLLLGIYYDVEETKRGVKDLVESNRGTSYTQYKNAKGYGNEFVLNYQLPFSFQNQSAKNEGIGIDNKGTRNTMIINRMYEMTAAFGDNFYFEVIFEQFKTFVCTISDRGNEIWGPMNKKYFKDDVLFALVFSYICAELCFPELVPVNVVEEAKKRPEVKFKMGYDKDYNLVRIPVIERPNGRKNQYR